MAAGRRTALRLRRDTVVVNRKRYLVTYDVSDDKRRTKIFKTLYAYGDHAQYSVFICELNAREYVTSVVGFAKFSTTRRTRS